MLKENREFDILRKLGKVCNIEEARKLFKDKFDNEQLLRISKINNNEILLKIANVISLCNPEIVYVNTGSDDDYIYLKQLALNKFEEIQLPIDGHTVHYDLKEEQGRIVDRTFYIVNADEEINSLANKMLREKAICQVYDSMNNIMYGSIMIVGFYMRGPIGSVVSNPAIEITSSAYVMHSAEVLYRNCFSVFEKEVERTGYFYTNIHSEGLNRVEDLINARVFMDRKYKTTYSFNCTYAGNTLLLKKGNHRFSVDRSIYDKFGKELSEHMFITGIDGPKDRVTWIIGAAPSGCGKTTTAMAGDHFIGDDLAQLWINDDGTVRAINPECGVFGIVEEVNKDGDPILMNLLRSSNTEVIWSNVLIDFKGVPHWVGNGEKAPNRGVNHNGVWVKGIEDNDGNEIPISHPNARCTISSKFFKNYSIDSESSKGVKVEIVTYSGRDNDTMPPVWVAKNSDYGVVIGACIVSASTATEVGVSGIKRAPWANAPFIPGLLGDYMNAQFEFFGSTDLLDKERPIIAGLNYFLENKTRGCEGDGLLGEKRDVKVWLSWLERYAHKEFSDIMSPIGFLPIYDDLKLLFEVIANKNYRESIYEAQFSIYIDKIVDRISLQKREYSNEKNIPRKFFDILNKQNIELLELKNKFGSIVTPNELIKFYSI